MARLYKNSGIIFIMTITHRTHSLTSTQRDAWVEINLSALEKNFKKLQELIKTDIMAVVKADAYGHGATTLCPILQSLGVNSFGVATVDEGVSLRQAGIKVPILILGATPLWAYESCFSNNLTITIYSKEQINQLEDLAKKNKSKIPVQLKIDTGMNRLGIDYSDCLKTINDLTNSNHLELNGIFSHLSDAKDHNFSKLQKERFDHIVEACQNTSLQKHIANTYAAINYPEFRCSLVRIGIGLYGQEFNFLEPLISLKGRITRIQKVLKGESVSYERTWTAKKDSLIATIPIGYADGVDRKLSNKIFGLYNDKKIQQIGTITMDQMMFDVSEIKDPKVSDAITLINNELPISMWARILNTISYELICRLKIRLPRVYTRD